MDKSIDSSFDNAEIVLDLLSERKSIRRFLDKKIPDNIIDAIINDGQEAPTACNHQMHHIVVVNTEKDKIKLQKISGSNDHFISASHIFVLCFQKGWNHNKFAVVQSTAAMTYHMCLSAQLRGIGTVWNAGIGSAQKVAKLLSIPAEFEIVGVLCLGYASEVVVSSKPPRRGINVIRSYNHFSRPDDHTFPLKSAKEFIYSKIKNHKNPYAQHNPYKWTMAQIREWRAYAVFAKSPTPGIYVSRRLGAEMEFEVDSLKEIENGEEILEIMPYAGHYTVEIARRLNETNKLHIADLSDHNLQFTIERVQNEIGDQVFASKTVIENNKLPYPDGCFDAVFLPQILETLPEPEKILAEAFRVLKHNGRIGVTIRNKFSWFGLAHKLRVKSGQVTNFGPYLPISPSRVKKLIQNDGVVEDEFGISPHPKRIGRIERGFMVKFSRLWVATIRKKNFCFATRTLNEQ